MGVQMEYISADRQKRFAQAMRYLVAEAYGRKPGGAHGRAVKWSVAELADYLGYAEETIKAFLRGRRVPPSESLPRLFEFLRKREVVMDFDRAWEWVRILGSAGRLKAVCDVFEPPPFVQTAPQPPASAVERAEEGIIWQRLVEGTGPVVIWGMPGIGKTTLGQQIAHREDAPLFFPDGVLWVELGPEWKTGDWIECWAAVLGMPAQDAQQRAEIVRRVSTGRYLIIIDNVWSGEAIQALRRHNPYTRLLVLCANQAVAQEIGAEPLACGKWMKKRRWRWYSV